MSCYFYFLYSIKGIISILHDHCPVKAILINFPISDLICSKPFTTISLFHCDLRSQIQMIHQWVKENFKFVLLDCKFELVNYSIADIHDKRSAWYKYQTKIQAKFSLDQFNCIS